MTFEIKIRPDVQSSKSTGKNCEACGKPVDYPCWVNGDGTKVMHADKGCEDLYYQRELQPQQETNQ